jgi:catechol 2,3-dioxygenase-like lactoylglutathione lyase family enzyme
VGELPNGGEVARPFLPSRDFDASKQFYRALGFEQLLDGDDVAIFRVGSTSFILQRRYQKQWAENCMMRLMVDDVDAWWAHVTQLDLPKRFGIHPPQAPAVQPWGLRVLYLTDPSGILWHIAERRAGVVHD